VGRNPAKAHGYGVFSSPLLVLKVGRKWANGHKFGQNSPYSLKNIPQKQANCQQKWAKARFAKIKVGVKTAHFNRFYQRIIKLIGGLTAGLATVVGVVLPLIPFVIH